MKYSCNFDKNTSCNFCRNGVFYYQQSKGALRTVSVSQSACFVSRKEEVCQSAPRRCVQSSVSRGVEPCWKGCVRAAGRRSVFLLLSKAACGQRVRTVWEPCGLHRGRRGSGRRSQSTKSRHRRASDACFLFYFFSPRAAASSSKRRSLVKMRWYGLSGSGAGRGSGTGRYLTAGPPWAHPRR